MANILVRKGNIELTVPEDQRDRYLKLGYDAFTEDGTLMEEAPLVDVAALQLKVADLIQENMKLKAEISKLKKAPKASAKN